MLGLAIVAVAAVLFGLYKHFGAAAIKADLATAEAKLLGVRLKVAAEIAKLAPTASADLAAFAAKIKALI